MSLDALAASTQVLGPLLFDLGIGILLALSVALPLSCGVLSLASAAFMGLGAWCAGLLSLNTDLPFIAVVLAGTLVPALAALVIGPTLVRLGSTRFALITLALGQGLCLLAARLDITGGAAGLRGIPARAEGWQLLVALVLVLLVLHRLQGSRFELACAAIRQEKVAAATSGIDVAAIRLAAFAGSAAIAGLAGSLQAHRALVLVPGDFGFEAMLGYLGMALLGGSTDLLGPLLGAALLSPWSSLLHGLAGMRGVFSGAVLLAVVVFLPRGLAGPLRRLWSRT